MPDAELRAELVTFAAARLARAGARSPAVRSGLGDVHAAAQDAVGDALEVLWARRAAFAGVRDPRTWAFGVVRTCCARAARAAARRGLREMPLGDCEETWPRPAWRTGEAENTAAPSGVGDGGTGPGAGPVAGVWAVRAALCTQVGPLVWELVVEVACGPGTPRALALREALASQARAAADGEGVDVAAVLGAARVPLHAWARARTEAGLPLDPTVALAHGVGTGLLRTRRALATWWMTTRPGPVDVDAVVAAGLVDDLPPTQQAASAAAVLTWCAPQLPATAPTLAQTPTARIGPGCQTHPGAAGPRRRGGADVPAVLALAGGRRGVCAPTDVIAVDAPAGARPRRDG
ncbi:hypothetical protein EBM89_10395 [Cellulomonas triticagri]|uniref:Uncharacterized protein n=1 Tax=Cellulomonas triticagri TaxID=2483352 RepID=A0A3M2JCU5_9CELL|nr:hypothetical protein EBM89_10395 [Cellulomonas triticagri]